MATDPYQALRDALAAGPTPGPWMKATDWNRAAVMQSVDPYTRVVCTGNQNNAERFGAEDWSGATWTDADYIAAANPDTIRALLAERDAPREALVEAPSRLYIDGEWNGFGGELISMALVADDGREFYAELGCDNPEPWIAENVMPKLRGGRESVESVRARLALFLAQFRAVHIVADWPEDIERFCRLLITGPGERIDTPPLTMEVVRIDAPSENPHHALADARGLRAALREAE